MSQQMIQSFFDSKRQIFDVLQAPQSNSEDMKDEILCEDFEKFDQVDVKKFGIDSVEQSPYDEKNEQLEIQSIHNRPLSQKNTVIDINRYFNKTKLNRHRTINHNEGYSNETWRTSALVIVYFITKFSDTFKFRRLSRRVFGLLNDRSSDYDFYLIKKMIQGNISAGSKAYRRFSGFFVKHASIQKFNAIEPDSYGKISWDTIMLIIQILNIFYIPTKLAFEIQLQQTDISYYFLEEIPRWFFLIDIILNFNTSFYDEGKINSNHQIIFQHYMKGDFVLDAIVSSAFFISRYQIPYIDFITMLRVARVRRMFENVEEVLNLRERFSAYLDLLRLIYLVIFVGHLCACAWYYLAFYEKETSWLVVHHLTDATTSTKYIQSLYWSVITLLTVGYGDIVPVTDIEMVFVIIMTLITCGVFGYAINSVGSIFKEIDQKQDKLRNQMLIINSHMRKNNINKHLQLKVRKYFEYYFQRNDDQDEKISQLMNILAPDLKNDFLISMYMNYLSKSTLLSKNLSIQCLQKLCQCVKEQKLSPDEVVFEKGQHIDRLYFIMNGQLKIFFETQNPQAQQSKQIRYFREGYVLGEKNFLLQSEMNYKAQAAVYSRIAYISYEDFINCTSMFPEEYEKVCLLKDKLHYNPLFKKVFTVCEICGSNHAFNKCPFPFFQCNRSKILYVENQSKPQDRQQHNRSYKRLNTSLSIVQQAGLAIQLNENMIIEEDLDDEYLGRIGFGENPQDDFMQGQFKDDSFEMDKNKQVALINKRNSRNSLHHCDEQEEVQIIEKVTRFGELTPPDLIQREREESHQFSINSNSLTKKGILKRSTYYPPIGNFEYISERQNSISECSEQSYNQLSLQKLQMIQRRERGKKLSVKYDRASQFLNKLQKLNTMVSQKSIAEGDSNLMKMSLKKIKTLTFTLDRQSSNVKDYISGEYQVNTQSLLYLNKIQEDAIDDFDKHKTYDIYFPEYNLEVILHQMSLIRKNLNQNSVHSKRPEVGNLVKKQLVSSYFHRKLLTSQPKSQIQIPLFNSKQLISTHV